MAQGTALSAPPAEGPPPAPRSRVTPLWLIPAVALVIAGVVLAVTALSPPAISLRVSDGSIVGVIEGNLTSIGSGHPLIRWFNATTTATWGGHPASTLTMQIDSWTYFLGGLDGHYYDGGSIGTTINVTIRGRLASGLRLSGLQFSIGEIGRSDNRSDPDFLGSLDSHQRGTNVSWDRTPQLGVLGTGSATRTESLVNDAGAGPVYEFSYGDWIEADGSVGHDRSVRIRAAVEGPFAPAIGLEIDLAIIDVPR